MSFSSKKNRGGYGDPDGGAVTESTVDNSLKGRLRRAPARLVGLGFVLFSLAFGKITVMDPIQAAQTNGDVHLSMKGVIVNALALMIGLVFLIFGESGRRALQPAPGTKGLQPIGWVILLTIFGLGIGVYVLVKNYITSLGYQFPGSL